MKPMVMVILLGLYMFAMGVLGLARTGSFTPLFINGTISAVTIWLGWLLGKGMKSVRGATITWLVINTLALAYMTFGRVPAHDKVDKGSVLIFGSMAAFALVTLLIVWLADPRRRPRDGRR